MKNLRKISCLVISGLWISTAVDAMNSNSVFNNQKSQSSSVRRQTSDRKNVDPNASRPTVKAYDGPNRNPLLDLKMTEAEDILGCLVMEKKTFTRSDILRVIEEKFSEYKVSFDNNKLRKTTNEVIAMTRSIGNDQNGDVLYWVKIHNYQKRYKNNFLHPIICSSVSDEWESAAHEWEVIYYGEDEGNTCICGKEDIKYISGIYNRINGNELYPIGSRCINKFKSEKMNKDIHAYEKAFNKISNGISKLRETIGKGESIKFTARLFSEELIRYLNKEGALDDNERQFLLDMTGKRYKRSGEREQINEIIESRIVPYIQNSPQNKKIRIDRQMLKQLKG
ncbi:MAG: hypothetical protein J6P84_03195 [Alphaproteobacteria bacterium]|nr:hypothetical protein [Alphaproteobacteria bacterium]